MEQQGWKSRGSFICANNKAKWPKGTFQIGGKVQQDKKKVKNQKECVAGHQKCIATKRKTLAGNEAINKKNGVLPTN